MRTHCGSPYLLASVRSGDTKYRQFRIRLNSTQRFVVYTIVSRVAALFTNPILEIAHDVLHVRNTITCAIKRRAG